MIILLLMNLIAGSSAFLLTYRILKPSKFIDALLSLFILYFSQIVFTQLLLGIFGILYLNNVILFNLFILLIIWFVARNKNSYFSFNRAKDVLSGFFSNKVILMGVCLILGFGLVKISINLVNPPFGWDCLNYHFTFPVEWLKHGNLDNPISISGDPAVSYYPVNASLFFLWFIFPLKNVFIADLGQVPFFVISFFALYSLARKLNLSKEYALFSVIIFNLIPNYFKQLEIAYIDIMVSTLFLIVLNYLFLIYKRERIIQNTILYSIALGLLLGTKITAMPIALILLIPLAWFYFFRYPFKKSPAVLALAILLIIIFGGFGYIRNVIQTGNPLYPLNFRLFNTVIFKGVVENEIYRTSIRPGDFSLARILFSEGLGAQTVIFLLPAILLALPVTIIKRRKDLNFYLIYFLILPFFLILIFRFIIPIANLRYIYGLFAIASIIAFYVADMLKIPKLLLKILILICIFASSIELAGHLELIISFVLSLLLFFLSPYIVRFIKSIDLTKLVIVFFIAIILISSFLEKDYIKNEYIRYVKMVNYSGFWPDATKAWLWLNQNTRGNNIAYIGRPVLLPLYGTNFKNNVYYVSVNRVEPAMLHYFPNSKYVWGYDGDIIFRNFEDENNYRGRADYNVWVENLRKRNIDYFFVYSDLLGSGIEFPLEDPWARARPGLFELVFSNDTIRIYKFNK
ncbi:MAG: hypothetical protein WC321_01265 [Candidatus Omnitrophota bacterium]|jgi:hypothetical protein